MFTFNSQEPIKKIVFRGKSFIEGVLLIFILTKRSFVCLCCWLEDKILDSFDFKGEYFSPLKPC